MLKGRRSILRRNIILILAIVLMGILVGGNYLQLQERKQKDLIQQVNELDAQLKEKEKVRENLEKEKLELEKKLQAKQTTVRLASTKKVTPQGSCLEWMTQAGITDTESAYKLIMRESGCNPYATNKSSGAYGIPQSLPAGKMASAGADWRENPVTQLKWMQNYVFSRYESWVNALAHSDRCGWY